jgi:hypothetical protein
VMRSVLGRYLDRRQIGSEFWDSAGRTRGEVSQSKLV